MERKGLFTPEGEKLLDKVAKFKNKALEAVDGPLISLIDNQGLERLKNEAEEKYPGVTENYLYPIADAIEAILQVVANNMDEVE